MLAEVELGPSAEEKALDGSPEKLAAMSPADVQVLEGQFPAKDAELKKTGRMVVSASLQGLQAAFALRPRGGKAQVTDGPHAEAKEMVGAFFIIEAADKVEAVRVASLHPAATLRKSVGWGIELHPIGGFEQASES